MKFEQTDSGEREVWIRVYAAVIRREHYWTDVKVSWADDPKVITNAKKRQIQAEKEADAAVVAYLKRYPEPG